MNLARLANSSHPSEGPSFSLVFDFRPIVSISVRTCRSGFAPDSINVPDRSAFGLG